MHFSLVPFAAVAAVCHKLGFPTDAIYQETKEYTLFL